MRFLTSNLGFHPKLRLINYYNYFFTRIIWFQKLERVEEACTASVSFCCKQQQIKGQSLTRGVGVLLGTVLGGGVSPGSPNPDPISDQKCHITISYTHFKTAWPLKYIHVLNLFTIWCKNQEFDLVEC